MEPIRAPYAIIQSYTDKRDRLETAVVVSEHRTADEAFADLERLAERLQRLQRFELPPDTLEMLVVDAQRRPVLRGH